MALVSPYCDVVTARLADVIDAMDAGFAGDRPRTWVNPHPNMQPPSDAEYSRLPDPAKYATVQQRCRAWITALLDADLATSQSTWQKLEPWGRVETLELTPTAPEAVRLFVHSTVDYLPGVVLALGDPMGIITRRPDGDHYDSACLWLRCVRRRERPAAGGDRQRLHLHPARRGCCRAPDGVSAGRPDRARVRIDRRSGRGSGTVGWPGLARP